MTNNSIALSICFAEAIRKMAEESGSFDLEEAIYQSCRSLIEGNCGSYEDHDFYINLTQSHDLLLLEKTYVRDEVFYSEVFQYVQGNSNIKVWGSWISLILKPVKPVKIPV